MSAEERNVEVVSRLNKRLRETERSIANDEDFEDAEFSLVELGPNEYTKMIKQLYRDIELCKKFREERIKSDSKQ